MKTRPALAASLLAAYFLLPSLDSALAQAPAAKAAPAIPAAPATAPSAAAPVAAKIDPGMDMAALVTADNEATLSSQMAGKIRRIHYAIGQRFNAGAVLAEFDCTEARAKLDALNAEYLGARETHLAKLRLQGLGAAGDLEVTLAAAAGEKAKSQVRQQVAQIAFCTVTAPYAGRVVRVKAKQAESVSANQPILEIVATHQIKATIHVPAAMAVRLKPGSAVSIDFAELGKQYPAKISRLNGRVDGVSQSLEVEAVFAGNTDGLLPGMIGKALFPEAGKAN